MNVLKTEIRRLREELGLTQKTLAKKVDVTRQTILFMEKGKYNPSLRLAYRVSQVLGKSIEEVFSFEDEEIK
jgi:putative transcriptional regulator